MIEPFVLVGIIAIFIIALRYFIKKANKKVSLFEAFFGISYFISILVFGLGICTHSFDFNVAIDPIDNCYSPFASNHLMTLIVFFVAFNLSAFIIWTKGIKVPPIFLVLLLTVIVIGIVISSVIVFQVSYHNTESLGNYNGNVERFYFIFLPFFTFCISISLLIKVITSKSDELINKTYTNKFLNNINTFLSVRQRQPFFIALFLLPLFFLITVILILFGQESDSLIKVFTDTTTWKLSQQTHPVPLDHTGHYLCTVAAFGNPKIVKPIRLGKRGGRKIVVNRQLMICNAFENLLEISRPNLHKFIRNKYDKYGYNLSKKINTQILSNLTYILMKPLEIFFLLCLYLFCTKPEELIKRQYAE